MAAGVSMLALAGSAEASVVITRKNIPIPVGDVVSIDLNQDRIADFQFVLSSHPFECFYAATFSVTALNGGAAVGTLGNSTYPGPYASALLRGEAIGPGAQFSSTAGHRVTIERSFGESCSSSPEQRLFGRWGGNPVTKYLGVRLLIGGVTHFGWIRLSVNFKLGKRTGASITAYAYETIPGKRILAGIPETSSADATKNDGPDAPSLRPPSLGMLALGADGMPLWRREE
jgi:hypothetical protein